MHELEGCTVGTDRRMRVVEPIQRAGHEVRNIPEIEGDTHLIGAVHRRAKVLAVDVLHRDVVRVSLPQELVDFRNVGVCSRAESWYSVTNIRTNVGSRV